ncbi:hypothetical protein Aperf_G00000017880 [Anoplocephala perfoliata]
MSEVISVVGETVSDRTLDYESSPNLEARRFARQQISDSACRRYTQAIGHFETEQINFLTSHSRRSRHFSPPSVLTPTRSPINYDLELPNLERCQSALELMEDMTPEQKISTKRGEQDYVQKKTFTNWMNTYLSKANPPIKVNDLFEEIRDGIVLIRLLEILSKETLPVNIAADMKPAYCLSNVKTALDFLCTKKVKLVNINPLDIVEGRPKIVLGLIWIIILYFQIEEQEDMLLELLGIPKTGNRSKITAKQALTTWVQNAFSEKFNINIRDFGPSWRDGVAFNAIVHSIDPRLVDMREVEHRSNRENLQRAFTVAEEKLGIPKILDPEDVDVDRPDEKSIMTYVAQFYKAFPETGKPKILNRDEKERRQFAEFLDVLQQTESKITESIQMNKNFKAAYPIYVSSTELLDRYADFVDLLQQKVLDGTLVGAQYSPRSGLDAFNHFEIRLKEWRYWLLERLPGELRQSGRWIVAAERWIDEVDAGWSQGEEDGIPVPSDGQKIGKLIEEQNIIFGPDFSKATTEATKLRKFLSKAELEEAIVKRLEGSMEGIISKLDGYVVTLDAASCYRNVNDAVQESNLGSMIEEWAQLASGNRSDENLELAEKTLDAFRTWDEKFLLSEVDPSPVSDLKNCLNSVMNLEQSARSLPRRMTSEVIGYWLQRTTDVFQSTSLGDVALQELGQRLEERVRAWKTFETNLNTERVDGIYKDLNDNRMGVAEVNLNPIEALLQEAESAAQILGRRKQLSSIAISRRKFDELKAMIEERTQEEVSLKETAAQKVKDVLASISDWNCRAEGLLSDPDQIPNELGQKIAAIQELLAETEELDDLLQSIEQTKPDTLADSQIEEMDAIATDFFQHQRTLSGQLKNLEQIASKRDEVEGLLSRLESTIKHPRKNFKELEEVFNETISGLTTSISDLENLIRAAPVKIVVQDLNFSDFQKRKVAIADSWKSLRANRRLETQALKDFEEAYGKADALIIELTRYFDAIESDLSSTNVDLIKSGLAMFEDLASTVNDRLPLEMESLQEAEKVLVKSILEGSNDEGLRQDCEGKVLDMKARRDDLMNRKRAIEKESTKASARVRGFKESMEVLEGIVRKVKPRLVALQEGPKIDGKSTQNDIDLTNKWHAECEDLTNLINSSQNETSNLEFLLEDPECKPPPRCMEIYSEYQRLRDEVMKILEQAKTFKTNFLLFKECGKGVEMRLQELKVPTEKSRWGSRQSLRTSASIDLSKRGEEIESQLQIEEKVDGSIREMESHMQKINSCSLPLELIRPIQTELDGLKKKVELAFTALKAERNEIIKSLEIHSKFETSLLTLEDWITSIEAQLKRSPHEASSIRENLQFQQEECNYFLSLFNEITTSGSQRMSGLLSSKEELLDESTKERKRRLKTRFDAVVKAVSHEKDRCSKMLNSWKELDSMVKSCGAVLRDAESRIERIEDGSVEQRVDSMKEAVQAASRRITQSQSLMQEVNRSLEDADKRIQQINQHLQRNLPKGINLEEIGDLHAQRTRLKQSQEELTSRLQGRQSAWRELQEVHRNFSQLLEQANSELLTSRSEYPSNVNLHQLKQIAEIVELIRQKEENRAKFMEDLKGRFVSKVDAKLAEMGQLSELLGGYVESLFEVEKNQAEDMKSKIKEIASKQVEINRESQILSSTFARIKKILDETNEKLENLIKSKGSRSPKDILDEIWSLTTGINQERQYLMDDFTTAVNDLQRAYLQSHQAPQFLGKLPDSIQECFSEMGRRLEKLTSETSAKATELDDLCLCLQKEISDVELEVKKITDLLELSQEVNSQQEIAALQVKLKELEESYGAAVARLKRVTSQATKVKTSERLNELTSMATKTTTEGQNAFETLKTSLKQLTTQSDKLDKSIASAREAVKANITAIQQNAQFRLPVRSVEELEKRLKSITTLEKDLEIAEGTSIAETPALDKDILLPGISNKFKEIQQHIGTFSAEFVEGASIKLQNTLSLYRENLQNARESLEQVVDAAHSWINDSRLQMNEFQSLLRDLEGMDRVPELDFEGSCTARMEGLQNYKDLERSWLPQQIRQVDKLIRDANATITGGFSLSNIDEVREKMEELQKFANSTKTDLVKATLVWETRVSEERELKQLLPMLEDIYNRFDKDLNEIEPRYRFVSAEEAEELLARLQLLRSQTSVGDELAAKIRLILSSNSSAMANVPLLSRWENLSKNRLDSAIGGIEQMIAEKTDKVREILILQTWLEQFQPTVHQAIIEAQSSNDVQALSNNLIQLKSQLKQWEDDRLGPYSRKPGNKDKVASLDGTIGSVKRQLDQLERLIHAKASSQKAIEERLKEIIIEVDSLCVELEHRNFRATKERAEAATAIEVCTDLRGSRESLKNLYGPKIENLFGKLYSLECDASSNSVTLSGLQACRKKLEGARTAVQIFDDTLTSQLSAWEDVLSVSRKIDSWMSDHESKRVKERKETSEFSAFLIEAFSKLESQRNMQRLEDVAERRLRELTDAKSRSAALDSVKELIENLRKKAEDISEGKAVLQSMLEKYEKKLNEKVDEDQVYLEKAENAHTRVKKVQLAVANLDAMVLECSEMRFTSEELNRRSENVQAIIETEIKTVALEDFELRVQTARGERLMQMLQSWSRERQAHDRLVASERESLKILTTSLREWLVHWNKSLEEARTTADLELGIQLTALSPPAKFHCLDNIKTLLQEQQMKKCEVEEVERKRGTLPSNEVEMEDSELAALREDVVAGERKANRYIADLTERCARVERLRENLGKAREWIKAMKKHLGRFKNLRSSRELIDDKEDNLNSEDIEEAASELRQNLNHSLTLLQTSMEASEGSGVSTSLLQVALTEVDKIDSEIEQMLSTVSQTKASHANYCILSAGLEKLIKTSMESVATNSARMNDLLTRCLAGDRRIRALSPLRTSTNRLVPQVERMILELTSLDELSWLNGSDMLVQELKFIEADIKMNAAQFQSMVDQCGILRRDYSDDSRTSQVDHLFQQNNRLLRACEELIDHFSTVAAQSTKWNATCQEFVNWTERQSALMSKLDISSTNSSPNEQTLSELKALQADLNTIGAKQQAVADETQKMTVAVSRALHAANTASTVIPASTPRTLSRQSYDFSINYRWHDSIMSAVATLGDLANSLPGKIAEYEKKLAQWSEIKERKTNLANWIESSDQKVTESIRMIEDQENGDEETVWNRQIQEMKAIESAIPGKRIELKGVEVEILSSPSQHSGSAMTDLFHKLNIFESRLKSHLSFMSDIQELADDFNKAANDLESWLSQYEKSPSQMDTKDGAIILENCRSILDQLVIRITSRFRQGYLPRRLNDTNMLLQELSRRKSTASALASGVIRQFQSLESRFESATKSSDSTKSADKSANDWQYFCCLLRQIQLYLDDNSVTIHGLLPTRGLDDAVSKLNFAETTLTRLEDFSTQLAAAANALRRDGPESSAKMSSFEVERIVTKYDPSMSFAARETVERMENVISKLKSYTEELKKLQDEWRKYHSDVDSLQKRLHSRFRPARRDSRISIEEIRNEGNRLRRLRDNFRQLIGDQHSTDPELNKFEADYRLLTQLGRRELPSRSPREISEAESDGNLRTEVLTDLLRTVRHIKSDVDRADRRAERSYHDLHRVFHRTMRRSSRLEWVRSDRAWRTSKRAHHCHICGRLDPSKVEFNRDIANSTKFQQINTPQSFDEMCSYNVKN